MENTVKFPKQLAIEISYDLAILLLVFKKMETLTQRDICSPMFTAVLFTVFKIWKPRKCPLMEE